MILTSRRYCCLVSLALAHRCLLGEQHRSNAWYGVLRARGGLCKALGRGGLVAGDLLQGLLIGQQALPAYSLQAPLYLFSLEPRLIRRSPLFIEGGPCVQDPASGLKSLTCSLRVRCSLAEGTPARRRPSLCFRQYYSVQAILC